MLSLKTFTPLAIKELIEEGLRDFGPRVAIILVLFNCLNTFYNFIFTLISIMKLRHYFG
tara:strand:- start:95 stop:271 length:177 start_codon:yes stop_codon:yes gene_type:complete